MKRIIKKILKVVLYVILFGFVFLFGVATGWGARIVYVHDYSRLSNPLQTTEKFNKCAKIMNSLNAKEGEYEKIAQVVNEYTKCINEIFADKLIWTTEPTAY